MRRFAGGARGACRGAMMSFRVSTEVLGVYDVYLLRLGVCDLSILVAEKDMHCCLEKVDVVGRAESIVAETQKISARASTTMMIPGRLLPNFTSLLTAYCCPSDYHIKTDHHVASSIPENGLHGSEVVCLDHVETFLNFQSASQVKGPHYSEATAGCREAS